MKFLNYICVIIALLFSGTVCAEPTVGEFLEKDKVQSFHAINATYISGILAGFMYYTIDLQITDKEKIFRPLYCQPGKLAIQSDQAIDILKRFAREDARRRELQLGFGMLLALQETFPCDR